MSPLKAKVSQLLSSTGPLANKIPGYLPRPIQQHMAGAIADAIDNDEVLLAEAGTGTGKTYAYLIPSIVSGKKVLIATGTKNLQDQLFHRDIPLLRTALAIPFKVAILKGRGNYLCLHRTNTYLHNQHSLDMLKQTVAIKTWGDQSPQGELEQYPGKIPPALIPYITSTPDNCLGQECTFFNNCFVFKARRLAQEADVIIINHHLFFADHQLRMSGTAELLPDYEVIVFDEAHQLPEIASQFLGESLSSRQLLYLARDLQNEAAIEAPDTPILKNCAEQLVGVVSFLLTSVGPPSRGTWEQIANHPQFMMALSQVRHVLSQLETVLEPLVIRGKGLENCYNRTIALTLDLNRLTNQLPENQIHWYEATYEVFTVHQTPMYIGDFFKQLMAAQAGAWIFTSATLSVAGNFDHFQYSLGVEHSRKLRLDSPFNFATQALMYLPRHSHQPNKADYGPHILQLALPLLRLTKGRTFFLFTSHRALREAADYLKKHLTNPLLIQGEASKTKLLDAFCATDDAILLGTNSFWEGVDIKNNHLYCVIIDKIPFMAPDDPILRARVEYYKRKGRKPFLDYQLPQAVIALRQGVGRLIRANTDKGVLMICDPRVLLKDYGQTVLRSLPPMSITHSLEDVAQFINEMTYEYDCS